MAHPFTISRCDNLFFETLIKEEVSLEGFAAEVKARVVARKLNLPGDKAIEEAKTRLSLFCAAKFGSNPSKPDPKTGKGGGSLRHSGNLLAYTAAVVEHDAGAMPLAEAAARLNALGIAFFGYTTPRHQPTAPRWRLVLPFSRELSPAEYPHQVDCTNGVVDGALAGESWAISQAWRYGRVDGVPFEDVLGDGDACIDEVDEDDLPPPRPKADPPPPGGKKLNVAELTEDQLEDLIKTGEHFYRPASELARRYAMDNVAKENAETNLRALFEAVDPARRDRKWSDTKSRLGRIVAAAYAKIAKKRGTFFRALVTYLTEDELWRSAIRFNQFAAQIEVSDPFPPRPGQARDVWRGLIDDDILAMLEIVPEAIPGVGKMVLRDAVSLVARRNVYHPVREYLATLEWDHVPRVVRLFLDYFPAELPAGKCDQVACGPARECITKGCAAEKARDELVAYYERVAECFMVGAVARIEQPGCKLDTLPVLVGEQGWNKSRGLRALCANPAWFTDDISCSLIDRDTKESLRGKKLAELAEFPHIRRDVERTKAFFSRPTDRYRIAYDRLTADYPRSVSFAGTTNDLEFIDVTGNRRYWPILMRGPADVAAIERDRDQLWAEAAHLYRSGFEWWLSPSLEAIAAEMQDAFLEDDIWDPLVAEWLKTQAPCDGDGELLPFTTNDVLKGLGYALHPDPPHTIRAPGEAAPTVAGKAEQNRMAALLKRFGFRRDRNKCRVGGRRERFWRPGPSAKT